MPSNLTRKDCIAALGGNQKREIRHVAIWGFVLCVLPMGLFIAGINTQLIMEHLLVKAFYFGTLVLFIFGGAAALLIRSFRAPKAAFLLCASCQQPVALGEAATAVQTSVCPHCQGAVFLPERDGPA